MVLKAPVISNGYPHLGNPQSRSGPHQNRKTPARARPGEICRTSGKQRTQAVAAKNATIFPGNISLQRRRTSHADCKSGLRWFDRRLFHAGGTGAGEAFGCPQERRKQDRRKIDFPAALPRIGLGFRRIDDIPSVRGGGVRRSRAAETPCPKRGWSSLNRTDGGIRGDRGDAPSPSSQPWTGCRHSTPQGPHSEQSGRSADDRISRPDLTSLAGKLSFLPISIHFSRKMQHLNT